MPKQTPADDRAALQGLWKLVSITTRGGGTVGTGVTHWQIDGDRIKEISPRLVDGGSWATLILDPAATPKRLAKVYESTDDDGTVRRREFLSVYELAGDSLRVWHASLYGRWPASASDADPTVYTMSALTRDHGPPPAVKQASGTPPIQDDVLGVVTWSDDDEQWSARITSEPGREIDVFCGEPDGPTAVVLMRLATDWLPVGDPAARRFASTVLLDNFNDNWRQDEDDPQPLTPAAFARRLTLDNVSVYDDGSLSLVYDDGGTFAGHAIAVEVDPAGEFTDAGIHG